MSKMISVASGFQYSVNIGYDLNNDDKLKNFIPTRSALALMEDILLSTNPTSTERARVLIGAYGKGKSHIVLTILAMLMKRERSLFEKAMPKIQDNPRLMQIVENYYDSSNKILPVIITGSNTSLPQAFLLALQRTLSTNGLLDIMPETNYKAAVQVINRWEKEFPETYKKLKTELDMPVKQFAEALQNFDTFCTDIPSFCAYVPQPFANDTIIPSHIRQAQMLTHPYKYIPMPHNAPTCSPFPSYNQYCLQQPASLPPA